MCHNIDVPACNSHGSFFFTLILDTYLLTTTYKFFLQGRLILILDLRNQKFEKFDACVGFHNLIFFFVSVLLYLSVSTR